MSTGKGLPSLARSRRSRSVSSRSACWLAVPRRLTAGRPAGRTPVGSHAWSAFGATPCDLRRRSSDSSRATSASAVAREDAIRRWVCSAARSRRRVSAAASCDARSAARHASLAEALRRWSSEAKMRSRRRRDWSEERQLLSAPCPTAAAPLRGEETTGRDASEKAAPALAARGSGEWRRGGPLGGWGGYTALPASHQWWRGGGAGWPKTGESSADAARYDSSSTISAPKPTPTGERAEEGEAGASSPSSSSPSPSVSSAASASAAGRGAGSAGSEAGGSAGSAGGAEGGCLHHQVGT
mmetsp:Transcript_23436/g.67124  ORF Transcript_23436/g.67124 Transcript_23436/m.67124 type:complete len:298 (-) Transcript_23436:154-1047(-)